ncbi:MAG TPA: VWA domain-containing protein [Bryobacteraceae bacterium]
MTSRGIIGLAIAAGLAAPLAFHAQGPIEPHPKATPKQPTKQEDLPPANIRVDSTLVLVPVEVSDPLNRPVSGMEKENFHVFDDKVEQKIVSFAMEDDPIAVCLVFDVSGSMEREIPQARQAASTFFKTANPDDEFCMVALASEAKLVVPLTTMPGEIGNQLVFTRPGGSTALLDGIYLALNEVRKSKKLRKALVIISDGGDNNSRYTEVEVRNAIRETDTLIYAIGVFGSGAGSNYSDQEVLTTMTKESGGRLFPTNGMAVADFAEKIITDLRNRYVLGYSPTNPAKDGRYHRLEVKLAPPKGLPKLSAHWKTGYYAASD